MAGEVTYIAADYSFSGPDSIPAGWTRIRLVNQGQEPHHLGLLKLAEGKTMADLLAALQAGGGGPPPGLLTEEGGPNAADPGGDSTVILNLEPGNYVMVCFIPSPDGAPHVAKGMMRPLTVTGTRTAASEPRATVTIDGADFRFDIPQEIPAGNQLVRFNNKGGQHHEVLVVQLAPGKNVREYFDFFEGSQPPQGPPPGKALGGMSSLEANDYGYFQAQFTPGSYGLICFLPDVTDPQGPSHAAKGMIGEITVR